jgi:hypothetical protein
MPGNLVKPPTDTAEQAKIFVWFTDMLTNSSPASAAAAPNSPWKKVLHGPIIVWSFIVSMKLVLGEKAEYNPYARYAGHQHRSQASRPFFIPSGLHALRPDPDGAGEQATSVDAAFLSDADGPAALHRRFRGGLKNEGSHELRATDVSWVGPLLFQEYLGERDWR